MNVLSVHNIFFTFLGYPMSYIEFAATLLIVVYVLLITKKKVYAWPLGIVAFAFFSVLYYQVRLYSDFFEQFYYIGNCFYGWWVWLASEKNIEDGMKEPPVSYCTGKSYIIIALIITAGGTILGFTMSRIHNLLPVFFPQPAAYPYIDATATVMGFVAATLMARKKIETWYLWICVNVICIGLYYVRNIKFVTALYVFFLALAINGLITWTRLFRSKTK
jgi:nicotinamide mononucleotide transporter